MEFNSNTALAFAVGLLFIFIFGRLFLAPMKAILKLLYNGIIGAVALILINLAGSLINFHIAINIFSAFIVGLLGVPGLILLIILKPALGL
jgi:inhibitor of the pro-sigma K processing machinery